MNSCTWIEPLTRPSKEQLDPAGTFCRRTRREFLWQTGAGFTGVALGSLLAQDGFLGQQATAADGVSTYNPLAPNPPMFPAKAKSVIFLFMYGGPSHVDLFDYKPELFKHDGKTIEVETKGRSGNRNLGRVIGPKWKFKRHGDSGAWVSSLFPHLSGCVDDMAFLKGMYAESPLHGSDDAHDEFPADCSQVRRRSAPGPTTDWAVKIRIFRVSW